MRTASAGLLCIVLAGLVASPAWSVVFVKVGGVGAGTSWADALGSIQSGIDTAFPTADQVWVARGTYNELITLRAGVAVYGGFVGTEATLAARPPFPRPPVDPDASIIDGNQGGSVVTAPAGLTATARLDGFTITDGKNDFGGGGILCQSSSPTIINNTITVNRATRGAGIYCLTASPTISANVITFNTADDYGGGICCETSASPTISGNTITDNTAVYYGGGVDAEFDSSPAITGNTISRNGAGNDGGGIFCFVSSNPNISQNTIEENQAAWYGGGIYCYQSSPTIFRCLIRSNEAGFDGGGIYCNYFSSPTTTDDIIDQNTAGGYGGGVACYWYSSPTLTNNSIVSNTALYPGGGIDCIIGSDPSISNNAVAFNSSGIAVYASTPVLRNNDVYNPAGANYTGLAAGVGDISSDPLFVNLVAGDYHLTALSPCRDAGWNGAPALPAVDYDGAPRIQNGTVDIGAFEYPFPLALQPLTIAEARSKTDGSDVRIEGVGVTATRTDFVYVEMADRTAGVRVKRTAHGCYVGNGIAITGKMRTNEHGERYVDAVSLTRNGGIIVEPVAVNGCTIRGSGLDCTGLLLRACGKVTAVNASGNWFQMECAAQPCNYAVKVTCPSGTSLPGVGWFVAVTGACSREKSGAATTPVIVIRTAGDMTRIY